MTQRVTLTVNGTPHQITIDDSDMPLLYALRDLDVLVQMSMAETKCARWQIKSVPVCLSVKGCMSP
jgi:hypothetical protein